MSLASLQKVFAVEIAQASWAADNELRGEKVAKFRRYQDGDHDAQMTAEMKNALRIQRSSTNAPFNSNQMDDVLTTMSDRLTVDRIEGDSDAATKWAQDVLDWNRFDGLQMDTHEATLRDADSYALIEFDADEQMPVICHELAWDGTSGMMVIHESTDKNTIAAAVKVWCESKTAYADTVRANIYYPDRIERYISSAGDDRFVQYEDDEYPTWPIPLMLNGQPLGVPVVQFRNRQRGKGGYGLSELENAIPLQDALNRTLHSMVMTAELSAFPVIFAKGFKMDPAITPGMVVNVGEGGLSTEQVADLTRIPGESVIPYIEMANFFIGRIEAVTRTPNMSTNTNLSGEAMKQSEVKLLGKVKRFQITAGNAWEDVMSLCARVQAAYGTKNPPDSKRWKTIWKDSQIRNDRDVVDNAMKVQGVMGELQTLRNLADVFELDEETIQKIMAEKKAGQADRLQSLVSNFNPFTTGGVIPRQPTPVQNGQSQAMISNGVTSNV